MFQVLPPCNFESDVSLASRAYYGIGGTARFLAHPQTPAELADLLLWNTNHHLPIAIMGKGSNILFSDAPFPGTIISLDRMQRMYWLSNDRLFSEAGTENTLIAEELLTSGKGGGEWLYRLPGQIGSTVRMNARCFGGEVSSVTTGVLTVSVTGIIRWQTPDEVFKGYKKTSLMDNPEIVVAVVLNFPQQRSPEEIKDLMLGYEAERIKKHHFDYPSCGSTFKNNYASGRSSGTIFDELGFKGMQQGGAKVSDYHANFIYNTGGATSSDVLKLAAQMRAAAMRQECIQLDLEVQCIGYFDTELLESCGVAYTADSQNQSKGWAGLLWNPQKKVENCTGLQTFISPQTLLQGPILGYNCLQGAFPRECFVAVEQLMPLQQALSEPKAPFLRWTTHTTNPEIFSNIPPSSMPAGTFTDGLWQYGVTELFIADPDSTNYLEFEMTPQGHWVALRFKAPRQRAEGYEVLSAKPWTGYIHMVESKECFGMEFSYKLLQPFISEKDDSHSIALQCSVSTGRGEYGLFPWWVVSQEPADFHQPDRYIKIRLL